MLTLVKFVEAISDPKTWLLFIFAIASNSPNGGLTTVSYLAGLFYGALTIIFSFKA